MTNLLLLYFINDSSQPNGNLHPLNPAHILSQRCRGYITLFHKEQLRDWKRRNFVVVSKCSSFENLEWEGKMCISASECRVSFKVQSLSGQYDCCFLVTLHVGMSELHCVCLLLLKAWLLPSERSNRTPNLLRRGRTSEAAAAMLAFKVCQRGYRR